LNLDGLRVNHDFLLHFPATGDQEQPHLQVRRQTMTSNIMTAG